MMLFAAKQVASQMQMLSLNSIIENSGSDRITNANAKANARAKANTNAKANANAQYE